MRSFYWTVRQALLLVVAAIAGLVVSLDDSIVTSIDLSHETHLKLNGKNSLIIRVLNLCLNELFILDFFALNVKQNPGVRRFTSSCAKMDLNA